MGTVYIIVTTDEEPELVGPFDSEAHANEWGKRVCAFEDWYIADAGLATSPAAYEGIPA